MLLGIGKREMALLFLTMWTCYLRPSEALILKVRDLVMPTRSAPHHALVLHPVEAGVTSKTGIFNDGVSLENKWFPGLGRALEKMCGSRGAGELLFKTEYLAAKDAFVAAMGQLKLQDASMYRCRHGGAGGDLAAGFRALEQIKNRGRWAVDSSVRRYTKSARQQQVEHRLDDELLARGSIIGKNLASLFNV